ncbi:TonB-dependent receptor [Pseudoxanthomonas sp.]|uniref:TonB-dependent receptor plug domain-containing protein n=1 Tax=Pseudoxanthomonas sp. TaxID=1871049 RepID=UPI0026343D09|nr:TonB-dependent receptor [Pseudoxanthomonas sp.]WDS37610.1 MAG: TonB-dependent receptor [Pseudoxanthomonas sp.]
MSFPAAAPLGLAIALALSATASAQTTETATNLDTVIVTGTRASNRTVLESTSPVDVLSADDIRKAGVVNGELGSALQALLPSFNFPRQSNSGGADHVRAAQLRGLSPDQVLVLINGKRRHTSALVNTDSKIGKGTTPVDFNSIPISAIKRIEVLRDGAGAQYGSDAIAGVINVILDDDPNSGTIEASFGANHTNLEPIHQEITDGQTGYLSAKAGTRLGEDGFIKAGLEYKRRSATNRAGYDQIPDWQQNDTNLALQGKRNYALGDGASRDINAWFNGELPFGQTSKLYAFGTYSHRDTQGDNYFRYPDDTDGANWQEIYPNGYRPVSLGYNRDYQGVFGARGQWGDWDYDASLDYGRNDFTYKLRDSLNASLGPTSPTSFKVGRYVFEQSVANLDLSRGFDAIGASHTFGTGVELRREDYNTYAGDPASYAAGTYTDRPTGAQAGGGLTPEDAADLSRNVASAYASVSSQFGDKFSTDLAGRYEHYQDFGSQWTGKLAARYAFTPAFALRGAISNNFRAPSLSQIGFESTSTGYGSDGQLVQSRVLSVNNPIAQALGATDLKPEKSVNYSLGFTSRIGEHFDLSLDFFQIDIDDRIALSESITGDALTEYVSGTFGVSGLQSASFFVNAADTRTRGAELVANWRSELFGGDLLLTGTYSYAKTTLKNVVDTPTQLLALDSSYVLFGDEESNTLTTATPKTRAGLAATWSDDNWTLSSRLSRYGSVTRVFSWASAPQTYGAEWQLDLEAEYRITPQWSVAIGGQNVTDSYPDLSNSETNYYGNLPYDVLSPVGSNGAYWYGRVRFTF